MIMSQSQYPFFGDKRFASAKLIDIVNEQEACTVMTFCTKIIGLKT